MDRVEWNSEVELATWWGSVPGLVRLSMIAGWEAALAKRPKL